MSLNYYISFLTLIVLLATFAHPSLAGPKPCNPQDKKVLLQIKKHFNDPYDLSSWDPKTDCCDWYGVKCNEDTGRVYSLFHNNGDFGGTIPPQVADLPYLEYLDFHKCPYIVGPIPDSILKLKYLKSIMITNCNISGPVPEFLGQMKTLDFISFAFNKLSGPIPSSIGDLPKLNGLRLDRNKLTGPIPDTFGNFKGTDFYLYLSHNELSGKIPASLGKKNDFSLVDLSRNKLEGDARPLLGPSKKNLWHLALSRNLFKFDFSNVKFPKQLVFLDINHNQIYGSLPPGLTKLELQTFNVSYNRLCGKIPVGGRLQEFEADAYFHNRCLCGAPLPPCK